MDKRRINVRAIIYQDGKLLAVRHKARDGSPAPYYAIPGGGLDPQESLTDGLKRELLEETGVDASIGRLLFIQQFPSRRSKCLEELEFFFEITNPQDFTAIDLENTSHGHKELAVCEFITPSQSVVYPVFLQTIDVRAYVDQVRPVLVVDNLDEKL